MIPAARQIFVYGDVHFRYIFTASLLKRIQRQLSHQNLSDVFHWKSNNYGGYKLLWAAILYFWYPMWIAWLRRILLHIYQNPSSRSGCMGSQRNILKYPNPKIITLRLSRRVNIEFKNEPMIFVVQVKVVSYWASTLKVINVFKLKLNETRVIHVPSPSVTLTQPSH